MFLVERLRTAGVDAALAASSDSGAAGALLTVAGVTFAVEQRERAPYPNELSRLEERRVRLEEMGRPLLLVPFASEALGPQLVQAGWSWADSVGNFDLRAPGLLLRQRAQGGAPVRKSRGLPHGSGSNAIIRALIRLDAQDAVTVSTLADLAKVSQPRSSQVVARLVALGLVEKFGRSQLRSDREALLDRFLDEYRGPGGSGRYLYALDPLIEVASAIAEGGEALGRFVVSADVGPDLIVAWRRPAVMVVYASAAFDPRRVGLVEALGSGDANVILRVPNDTSVFPSSPLSADFAGIEIPLADPTQMIWDLVELGGADRLEAAGVMREWLLADR